MIRGTVAWGRRVLVRWGRQLLAAGLVVAVVAFLGRSVIQEWETLKHYPWQLNIGYLILASAFHSLSLGVTFVVWHLMLRRLGPFDDLETNGTIYYLSTLAKRVPSAIWYIGGRLAMYQRVGVARSAVLNAVALEAVLIGSAGAVVYLVLQPFYRYAWVDATWIVAGLGGLAILLFLIRPRLLLDATNLVLRYRKQDPIEADLTRQDLLLWGGIYLAPWFLAGASLLFLIRAMTVGVTADVVSLTGVSTLSMLVGLMSLFLPAGLGLKELTMAALLSTWMPLSAGVVVAIALRVLQTFDEIVWVALVHVLWGKPSKGRRP